MKTTNLRRHDKCVWSNIGITINRENRRNPEKRICFRITSIIKNLTRNRQGLILKVWA
jgi:hypothetical protein